MRNYLLVLLFALSFRTGLAQRPNIIFILADDLGYADLGCFGAKGVQTPRLDSMAAEGLKLTSFYVMPSCSPSRAALMTGCYPQRVGFPFVVGPEGPEWTQGRHQLGLHPQEETVAEVLREAGYATACIGKWHLGHHPEHLPTHHGFDEYFGLPYSNDMRPTNNNEWPDLPLIDGETVVEINPDQSQLTQRYTQRALTFLEQHQQEPFFLYLAYAMPHVPLFASERFQGKSALGLYGDVVQEIDGSVGAILDKLRELQLDDNTLVIFTSDNGPWLSYGNHAGSAGPWREGKATTFEGGVRVPFVARWPDQIPAGNVSDAVVSIIDILPTLAEVAQATLPALPLDGQNMYRVLKGTSATGHETYYYFEGTELEAVRKGPWKLHFSHPYRHVTAVGSDGARGETAYPTLEQSLFNLDTDPGEQYSVMEQHPKITQELQQLGETFRRELTKNKRDPAVATLNQSETDDQ